jgi:hypothetical protein
METSPKVMLPFHIAVAMHKYPLESLSAPAVDSIREKWEKGFRRARSGGFSGARLGFCPASTWRDPDVGARHILLAPRRNFHPRVHWTIDWVEAARVLVW